jgi:MFS family permease
MPAIKNNKKRIANRSVIFMLIGLFMMFGPINFGWIGGMEGGFAIGAFGFMIAVAGFVSWLLFLKLARSQDAILSGKNLVVHWKYEQEEWTKYTENEHKTDRQGKKILFFIISGFALFFGILFFVLDPENGIFVLYVMLGLIAVIGLTAFLSIRYSYRHNKKHLGEAIISRDGVYLNKQLYAWNIVTSRLDKVILISDEQPPVIEFSYSTSGYKNNNAYSVRVPVPKGQEAAAIHLVELFNNEILVK